MTTDRSAAPTTEQIENALRDLDRYQTRQMAERQAKAINLTHEIQAKWDRQRARVAQAPTFAALEDALRAARDGIDISLLALWANGKILGATSSHTLIKKAERAEKLATYIEANVGDEHAAAARAAKQRERAELLRRRAAGEEVEIPTRSEGTVAKIRAIFETLREKTREDRIAAAVAAGYNRNTVNTQHYRWTKGV
jgi:antitoxin (DNA-binding transcriptional repressor) of toxin-antitoxin stability system